MRLLDVDKVLVFKLYYDDETEEFYEKEFTIEDFIDTFAVDGCPKAVDAEPTIRCKDCKYWNPPEEYKGHVYLGTCARDEQAYLEDCAIQMDADDFCSRGVKR